MIEISRRRRTGPPGRGGAVPALTELPPMKANSESSTCRSSGTRMSAPPISDTTVSSTWSPANSAWVRSRSAPPMMFRDVARSARRQRPLRSHPPMIAISQRAPPGPRRTVMPRPGPAAAGAATAPTWRSAVSGARSAPVLAA